MPARIAHKPLICQGFRQTRHNPPIVPSRRVPCACLGRQTETDATRGPIPSIVIPCGPIPGSFYVNARTGARARGAALLYLTMAMVGLMAFPSLAVGIGPGVSGRDRLAPAGGSAG